MNRHHPYGGYDQGPPDRGNRPVGESGYGNEGSAGGYYPSPAPPQHHQPPAPPPHHYQSSPSMNGQNDYQGGPNRDYREGGYPSQPPQGYRPGPSPGMPPPGGNDGRLGPSSGITLGSGPLNNQSQYGGPIRYDGGQSPASSIQSHNTYGSAAPDHHRYTAENASNSSRALPPQMRPQSHYDLPPKPDPGYSAMPPRPPLGSPPSHLPRPPGREWSDDQPAKRARREDSLADEDRPSDAVIRDRIKRERPCRTLFCRNIEFNADIEDLRRRFEAFGEVKSWFDLTSKRGLLFISYFDLRQAEYAKDAMQEFEVNGRRMDVHYSLPREIDMTKRCDRDKDQGTLFILLKRAQGELDDEEVRTLFAQYGEIKSLRRYKDQGNCRFIEFYDCRACKAAHDALLGNTWNGGTWDIKFAWDAAAPDRIPEKPKRNQEPPLPMRQQPQQQPDYNLGGYGRDGGGGPPAQSPGGPPRWGGGDYGAPPQPNPGYPPYGPPAGSDYRPPPPPPGGQPPAAASYGTKRSFDYDDRSAPEPPMRRWGQPQGVGGGAPQPPPGQYGPPRPEPPSGGGYGPPQPNTNRPPYGGQQDADYGRYRGVDRNGYGAQPPPPGSAGPPPPNRWGAPAPASGGYGTPLANPTPPAALQRGPPPPPPPQVQQQKPSSAPANDDRLEQAQKVQQLLASLKPGVAAAPKAPVISSPTPAAGATAAPAPSLPSNIAALLQMAQNNAAKK